MLDSKLVQARAVLRTREEQLEIGLDTAAPTTATNSPPTTLVHQELPVLPVLPQSELVQTRDQHRQSTADPEYEPHSFHPDPNFQLLEMTKSLPVPPETLYRRNKIQLGGYSSSNLASPGNGFYNLGNTCYFNSTLQALFHTPAFVNYLVNNDHEASCDQDYQYCFICLILHCFRDSQEKECAVKFQLLYEKIAAICPNIQRGRQEDAHEFLLFLLSELKESYLEGKKILNTADQLTAGTTPFNQIFGGYTKQDILCLQCNEASTSFPYFEVLTLNLKDSIGIAVRDFFADEIMEGGNEFDCGDCEEKVCCVAVQGIAEQSSAILKHSETGLFFFSQVPAVKKTRMEQPPAVLCLQLSRFDEFGGKDTRPVTIPTVLDIGPHFERKDMVSRAVQYKLRSSVNHLGANVDSGHYTCVAEAPDGFTYLYDDATVRQTSFQRQDIDKSSYILFYEMFLPSVQVPAVIQQAQAGDQDQLNEMLTHGQVIPVEQTGDVNDDDWVDLDNWSEWEDCSQEAGSGNSGQETFGSIDGQEAASEDTWLAEISPQHRRYSTSSFYTPEERHFTYNWYGDNKESTHWKKQFDVAFREKFQDHPIPHKSTVYYNYHKMNKHHSCQNLHPPGRPRSKTDLENDVWRRWIRVTR